MSGYLGSGCMNSPHPCPYRRDMSAVLDALNAAGSRGRARSGLAKAIREAALADLGWDIGAGSADHRFAAVMDEFIRHGVRIRALGNGRGGLTFYAPEVRS